MKFQVGVWSFSPSRSPLSMKSEVGVEDKGGHPDNLSNVLAQVFGSSDLCVADCAAKFGYHIFNPVFWNESFSGFLISKTKP